MDEATLCLLIESSLNPNWHEKTEEGTLLHFAAKNGLTAAVNLLIAKGVPVDLENRLGWTPLYIAQDAGQLEMFELLLSHGANPNARCFQEPCNSSLYRAVRDKNYAMILQLMKDGASLMFRRPSIDNTFCDSPLELAMGYDDISLVDFLFKCVLKYQSEVDYSELSNLSMQAIRPNMCELLIRYLARMDVSCPGVFYHGLYNQCVEELIEMKEHVIFRSLTLHELFARRGWARVSLMRNQQLLNAVESCNYETRYPIYSVMLKDHLEEANTFSKHYYDLLIVMKAEFKDNLALLVNMETILDFMSKDEIIELSTRYQQEEQNKE